MAGGLGTRMSRFTSSIPKALIPVNGEPFVRLQLRNLQSYGVDEVVICTGYLGELIEDEIRNSSPVNMRVSCVPDGPHLLGTGGSLRMLAERHMLDSSFLYTYGDSYLTIDHGEIYRSFDGARYDALMTVCENSAGHETSNAEVISGRVALYRKGSPTIRMKWIDYGLSVIKRDVVTSMIAPNMSTDISAMFHQLSVSSRLQAAISESRYFEIGSETGLTELESFLNSNP